MSKKKFNHKAWQERSKITLADAKNLRNKEYADKQRAEVLAELRGVFGTKDTRNPTAATYQSRNRKNMTSAECQFNDILLEIAGQFPKIKLENEIQKVFYPNPKDTSRFFIIDFYITKPRTIAVEIDGEYHSGSSQSRKDSWRQQLIEDHGIRVLRYDNSSVFYKRDTVKNEIMSAVVRK